MFTIITEKSHNYLQDQINELKDRCASDSGVKEMVRYIITYSDEMAYCMEGSEDAAIGREIIQFIYQICGTDLSPMANSYHFNPSWAESLNSFIGNYINDDFAFDFMQDSRTSVFEFKAADYNGRWLQNPMVIVEAAIANRQYYSIIDDETVVDFDKRILRYKTKVDGSKVYELLLRK